ncbi:MAG: hypothetical protein WDW38_009873 [Sanguina aurantia]
MANKLVFYKFHFQFVTTLTLVHTIFTFLGMVILSRVGFFEVKPLGAKEVFPLAITYVGYVVLGNASLNLNSVALYQILKIAVAPTVMLLEFVMLGKSRSRLMVASVVVVCMGVTYATITDSVVVQNLTGLTVGLLSTLVTALYQLLAGSKQKDLKANSSQLLLSYTPQAIAILAMLVPLRPCWASTTPLPWLCHGSAMALPWLRRSVGRHIKTVIIFIGAYVVFNESMPFARMLGISVTAVGIIWYTYLNSLPSKDAKEEPLPAVKGDLEKSPLLTSGGNKP